MGHESGGPSGSSPVLATMRPSWKMAWMGSVPAVMMSVYFRSDTPSTGIAETGLFSARWTFWDTSEI